MRITVDRFAKTEDATQLLYRSGGVCSAEKRPIVRKPDSVRNEENKSSRIKRFGGDGGSPTRDLGVRSASLYASELRPLSFFYTGFARRLHLAEFAGVAPKLDGSAKLARL